MDEASLTGSRSTPLLLLRHQSADLSLGGKPARGHSSLLRPTTLPLSTPWRQASVEKWRATGSCPSPVHTRPQAGGAVECPPSGTAHPHLYLPPKASLGYWLLPCLPGGPMGVWGPGHWANTGSAPIGQSAAVPGATDGRLGWVGTQTHIHQVGDAIQPSHPLSSPSPPALSLFQHQGPFKCICSPHQVAKVLEL